MFWSAFATQEQTFSVAPTNIEQTATAFTDPLPQPVHDGSVEDHHLDDQPAQVHAEGGGSDLYALLPARFCALPAGVSWAWHWPDAEALRLTPYLDGLQRPPRALALIA